MPRFFLPGFSCPVLIQLTGPFFVLRPCPKHLLPAFPSLRKIGMFLISGSFLLSLQKSVLTATLPPYRGVTKGAALFSLSVSVSTICAFKPFPRGGDILPWLRAIPLDFSPFCLLERHPSDAHPSIFPSSLSKPCTLNAVIIPGWLYFHPVPLASYVDFLTWQFPPPMSSKMIELSVPPLQVFITVAESAIELPDFSIVFPQLISRFSSRDLVNLSADFSRRLPPFPNLGGFFSHVSP